ncbi:hypothetical protein BGZ74_006439 [Mortierella antarctica]|nr:hypothetical protein BGZ74_006439 [Mortierella antarctica]
MAAVAHFDGPKILQYFKVSAGKKPKRLPTQVDKDTMERYVLWSDIQRAFPGVDYVVDPSSRRNFLMADENYQPLLPPRLQYSQHWFEIKMKLKIDLRLMDANDPLHQVRRELKDYKNMLDWLRIKSFRNKDEFLQSLAAEQYFLKTVLSSLTKVNTCDGSVQREVEKIRQEIAKLDQQRQQGILLHRNELMLLKAYGQMRHPPNQLFIVLPENLSQWDPLDSTTHTFRLYFMCNNTNDSVWSQEYEPSNHIHITSHPGYAIEQPQKFLRQYGQHVLHVLDVVKHGFYYLHFNIPELDTFEILKSADGTVPLHDLSKDNIGSLVDTAIAYIQALPVVKWETKTLSDGPSLCEVTTYLQVPDGDRGAGDLYRCQNDKHWTRWVCKEHRPDEPGVQAIKKFLDSQEGTIDLPNRTMSIRLTSTSQAFRFAEALKNIERGFKTFLHIAWNASRAELTGIIQGIVRAGVRALHVHWTCPDYVVRGPLELNSREDKLIVLCDYPRPRDTYILCSIRTRENGAIGLLLKQPVNVPDIDWKGLSSDLLDGIRHLRAYGGKIRMVDHVRQHLTLKIGRHRALAPHLVGIDLFDEETRVWKGRIGVENSVVYGLAGDVVPAAFFHNAWQKHGTLRRLVLDIYTTQDVSQMLSLMAINPMLDQLDIPAQENSVFRRIKFIRQSCCHRTLPLELTFAHRQEFVIARVVIGKGDSSRPLDTKSHRQKTPSVDIVQWHLEQVSEQLQDSGADLLDAASLKFPAVLVSFTLDVTRLSKKGLVNIQNVLQRSALKYLHIRCVSFAPSRQASIAQVLKTIQWSTIKSLVFSGNNINNWLRLLYREGGFLADSQQSPTSCAPSLLRMEILGSGGNSPSLSHSSALLIHEFIYSSRLVNLRLENVQLRHIWDWELLIGSIDRESLSQLILSNTNIPEVQKRMVAV